MNRIIEFLRKNSKFILYAILFVMALLLIRQCDRVSSYKKEKQRLENNLLALNDTLKNYKKNGVTVAEMRALQLKYNELADSLKMERNKKPLTIIKYISTINDSLNLKPIVIRDTVYKGQDVADRGVVKAFESKKFQKSSRSIDITVPYMVNRETGLMETTGNAIVKLDQDIWVEAYLYKDKKNFTYLRLKTDYPSLTFNTGTAIEVLDDKYDYKQRKQWGVGLGVQVGYGVGMAGGRIKPTPYIGLGVSLNWNPRFLQF